LKPRVGTGVVPSAQFKGRACARRLVKTLQDALSDFSLRLAAPPPAFAADVVIARQMYFAALKVENSASRFLIIYTALAVFSTFKLGTRGGTQDRIDQILTAEDPRLPVTTPPGRTRAETEYTKARNDLLHADERGRTPASALAALEGLTSRLQSLAGRILLKG
jgi:hypothetical protein